MGPGGWSGRWRRWNHGGAQLVKLFFVLKFGREIGGTSDRDGLLIETSKSEITFAKMLRFSSKS